MSNQAPPMDITDTDPKQLAGLIAEDDIGERIWRPEELAAMTRCSRRIATLDDGALRGAVDWALGHPWLEDITRAVFTEGRRFVASRGARPARVAADGRRVQGQRP